MHVNETGGLVLADLKYIKVVFIISINVGHVRNLDRHLDRIINNKHVIREIIIVYIKT